jgi:Na+/melibiose symporter-like transporter
MGKSSLNERENISPIAGVAYALPVIPVLILASSNNVLSGLYATHHGFSLATISLVMLLAGLFDAITDPSIGYFSDRHHARTGSRKLFVMAGALLLIPCAWFLLNPGDNVTLAYFLSWYLLFYLALTLFQIPHLTWGGEISTVTEEKTKVYAWRNYAVYGGMILFALVPMLPFTESSKITPETMKYLVLIAGLLLMPALLIMNQWIPKGGHFVNCSSAPENPFIAMKSLGFNRPLMLFVIVATLYSIAQAFYIGLKFMMMDAFLGMGESYVYLLLFHLLVASVAVRPAMILVNSVGKAKAWMMGVALSVLAFMTLPLVLLNNTYSLVMFVVFNAIFGVSSAISNTAMFSLLSDISDYGTWKSGVDRSATCFSLQSLASKTSMAVGIALSIGLAGQLGFDPALQTQGPQVYWALCLCMGIIPSLLSLIAAYWIPKISIDSRRHGLIRKRLTARMIGAQKKRERTEQAHVLPVCLTSK